MATLEKFHFRATKAHWPHASAMVGLIVVVACLIALADGLQNWTGLVTYGVAAFAILLSMQPWRSFLDLDQHGFRVVSGAQSTFIQWCEVTALRPAQHNSDCYGGVSFTAQVQPPRLFSKFRSRKPIVISGTIDARLYGISDGQLYQLMMHLRAGSEHRPYRDPIDLAVRMVESRVHDVSGPQVSAKQVIDQRF